MTELKVGSRVRTKHSFRRSDGTEAWSDEAGSIVDDFAPDAGAVSRQWAVARRWGVALDNGCLVFRDSDEVTPE